MTTGQHPETDTKAADSPRGGRLGAGVRHAWARLSHTVTTGHQSAEEIRRILVQRQLTAYEAVRETAREELDEVRGQIVRMERRGAADGWTAEERAAVRGLRDDRKRRERAYRDLVREEFEPVQPAPAEIRRARQSSTARRAVALLVLLAAAVALMIAAPGMLLLAAPGMLALLWWLGGRPAELAPRAVPERLLARPELAPDGEADGEHQEEGEAQETDMRQVSSAAEATACVSAALAKRGVGVRSIGITTHTAWGWETALILRDATAADVVKVLPRLDVDFRVGVGRTMAAGDQTDGARVTLRVLTSDPFATPPGFPVRAPRSCSILRPVSPCVGMDGSETPLVLAGVHTLVVASSGGGKSVLARSLAEYVTACTDAVGVDIDPTGRGLGPLRQAAARVALTPEDAEAELKRLLVMAQRRIAALGETEDSWLISSDRPAVIAFLDEYPQLTQGAKESALDLLRIGRKARITLVICTQDATADIMGDAVADAFGIRILLPCREADVPVVLHRTAIADGWLPHRLVPGDDLHPADAGRCFVLAPGLRDPILRYAVPLDADTALERARERVAAGLPALDAVTAGTAAPPPFVEQLLKIFAVVGEDALTVAQLAEALAADDSRWRKWDGRKDRLAMVGREIKRELKEAGLVVPTARLDAPGRPTAYRLEEIRAALEDD
ncbi:type IV secretory system conjugative DNA transfer family protein [Streptomyces jumonjinensis]|uniref:type IV secretory system conjugative DNA transfer family protein n=1 Tax=Streptomyces jumonjinensis TaxID=1945 RepID=UPI0037B6DE04